MLILRPSEAFIRTIKREAHLPVTDPIREQQVIEKAQELAKGDPLPAETVGNREAKLDAAAP